ncbi:alkene reductase [Bradymonas sediminis]|uniref:Alkene reductase n=1 Tax=Bradymonas sediminis TaxID=1548548 RepID=A0A2Z4FJL4_9DELT|nr:alkene reductase [Bradymonas sediminis]AWV88888.1 alkene reductase [Bradymonas sediminis]TDP71893.1 2,4-dienoyl-CoA reductase-like NADH-dependent reductase (Old Yellow Enzyme family) [Bradymonas sediminis]
MSSLFEPFNLGAITLKNRVAMAPMTRSRAVDEGKADAQTALYYTQRASAGLIISEGVAISEQSQGYLFVPGLYTEAQVEAWRPVTESVHQAGGRIFAQLWHVGRISHPSARADGGAPVSSVAVQAKNSTCYGYRDDGTPGRIPPATPRALSIAEIQQTIEDYAQAAENAIRAGFDGVEIHAANGYLIEQFINATLNTRADRYGGATIENRARLALEVLDAVVARIGGERTAIRFAPFGRFADMHPFADEEQTWLYMAEQLNARTLAFVHFNNQLSGDQRCIKPDFLGRFRAAYDGVLMMAGGLNRALADSLLNEGLIDLAAFGVPYIANPDLVARMQNNWPIATPNAETIYGGGTEGYTDYPAYQSA